MPAIPRTLLAGLGLGFLVAISYLPAAVFHLSINPLYRNSGLASHSRAGLTGGFPFIDPNAGTTTQSLGHLSAEDWLHGRVPWWNHYAGVGLPLAAEMQSEAFFLPFVLLLHFSGGVIYLRIAMQVLAGVATFMLLRQLRLGFAAAFLGGMFYTFNGTFAWFAHGEIMPLPFLPLFLLGIERAATSAKEQKRGGWVLISVSMAYSIYAGFPETAFMDGMLAFLWAIVRLGGLPWPSRKFLLAKICIGGAAGLLLTAPLLVPFFEYLQHSGVAHNDFGDRGLPRSSFLQLFLPYVYGPIEGLTGVDSTNELVVDWGNIGGYFGITAIFLAVLGAVAERRERALRMLLALWIVLVVARTIDVPGTHALFRLIPGMKLVAVYRNSSGSFEMAVAILAAFAIERWIQGSGIARSKVLASAGLTAILAGVGLELGRAMIQRLEAGAHRYSLWLWGSVAYALFFLILTTVLSASLPTRRRIALFSAAITAECMGLYLVPHFAGLRDAAMDMAPLTYLKDHLGWQRAYALGGIHPNYGSYYQIPFIDHESLPVSDSWIRYLRTNVDAEIDAVTFSGDVPPPLSKRAQTLRRNLTSLKETGVLFVTAPRNTDPLEKRTFLPHAAGGNIPVYLNEGQQITGTLPKAAGGLGSVETATVMVGTDAGAATGVLRMQLCSGSTCVEGNADLTNAADNAPLPIHFSPALIVNPAAPLRYTLTHIDSKHPVAIWMFPSGPEGGLATLPNGAPSERTPDVSFAMAQGQQELKPVFQSSTEDIFELSNPAPYFDVKDGGCKLTIESHQSLRSSCPAAATLIRRELFYPGWRAFVNGRETPLRASSIFQAVDLSPGESRIEFRYVPTNTGCVVHSRIVRGSNGNGGLLETIALTIGTPIFWPQVGSLRVADSPMPLHDSDR